MRNFFKYICRNLYCLVVFSLGFVSFPGKAQQLILKNFKLKDGLPSTEVYCVFQDSKGFIWLGSDGGVSRFDGYSFRNYTTEDGLADNVVFEILEDRHGRIWFRSLSGRLCYIENDSIHKTGTNEIIQQYIKNGLMISFYMDSGDTLWCGLRMGAGYLKIAPPYDAKNLEQVKTARGHYLVEIENGNFISGVCYLDQIDISLCISFYDKQVFRKQIYIPDLKPEHVFYNKPAKDICWIADKEKLFSIRKDTIALLRGRKQVFNAETILFKKSGNYMWLGLLSKGVLKFENNNLSTENKVQILDGYSVSDVLVDREGGTWFTTLENGVYYSSPSYFISYQDLREHSAQRNYSIEKIGKNHLLVSNKPGLVDIVSADSIIRNVSTEDARITRLLERPDVPSLLFVTGNAVKTDSFTVYLWMKEKHALEKIRDSLGKDYAIIFYACDDKGKNYLLDRYRIFVLDKSDHYLKVLAHLPSRTFSFYVDKKNVIWLGCLNGLWSFENNKFIYHGNENELLKSAIEDIKEGPDGTRYYATRGNGIIICKSGKYFKITTKDGLSSNNCKCLYVDGNNAVWAGSKNGICRLKEGIDGWQVSKFNLSDNEFSYDVYRIEKTGNKLWLFTKKGLLSYELTNKETEIPPPVYMTQFSVDEIPHLKDSTRIFSYSENFVKISYVGLSYQSQGKLYYAYKMEGLDTTWRTTQSTYIQFPFLPPGNYKFYIKAISFNGVESTSKALVCFTIKKPFWQTLWFIAAVACLLIISAYLFFIYRLRIIRKKEEEKTFFNKQLAQLEMKALRSQMNPHFIFNAINSIQHYIVKNDNRTAQDYLSKFAHLIRNVLENSKQENISLSDEMEALKLYIELEQLRAPGKFSFQLNVQEGLQLNALVIPPLILQPYVENAILHGLTPLADGKGQLIMRLEKKENNLVCIIEDNGIGREKAEEIKQKKQLLHRSMGLSVTADRIKVINNLHKVESSITIEDRVNEEGEAEGTRVIIVINLHK